jgi:uncharacterized protein YceH (UPF0502 family)
MGPMPLAAAEIRVLGALVEKAVTTPEYYPLTMNALINACNQKSNRDPMSAYDEETVLEALDGLRAKGLIHVLRDARAVKYQQYFAEAYETTDAETALLCELMLRGPQTAGELRGRIERFGVTLDGEAVEIMLEALRERLDSPLVTKLPRQPGRREQRYAHLLAGEPVIDDTAEGETPTPRADRLRVLEEEVAALREEITALRAEVAELRSVIE